jgi:hypothetical protein
MPGSSWPRLTPSHVCLSVLGAATGWHCPACAERSYTLRERAHTNKLRATRARHGKMGNATAEEGVLGAA